MKLKLSLGALADPIAEQLEAQGYEIDDELALHIERSVECANYLRINGYMANGEYDKVARRIMKTITKHAKPLEGGRQ